MFFVLKGSTTIDVGGIVLGLERIQCYQIFSSLLVWSLRIWELRYFPLVVVLETCSRGIHLIYWYDLLHEKTNHLYPIKSTGSSLSIQATILKKWKPQSCFNWMHSFNKLTQRKLNRKNHYLPIPETAWERPPWAMVRHSSVPGHESEGDREQGSMCLSI